MTAISDSSTSTTTPTASEPKSPKTGQAGSGHISEIHGLRGIALALVVAFHLFGNGRVSGGIDVFLVISGFLATRSLVGKAERGQVRLREHYGRTFARLAAPALLVLAATAALMVVFIPQTLWTQTTREIIAAATYTLNWELISGQLTYGAAGPSSTPVQHFWSLAVQGQFFLVWPLAILALAFVLRGLNRVVARGRLRLAPVLFVLTALAFAVSFAYAIKVSGADQAAAYFNSITRFWEIGAGALTALALRRLSLPETIKPYAAWAGLALVVTCGFVMDGADHFPGPLALWPVAGALLVMVGSTPSPRGPRRMLETRPLRFVADISYELYLWHWPLLIAWLYYTGGERHTIPSAAGVLIVSTLLAWATNRLVTRQVQTYVIKPGGSRALVATLAALAVAVGVGGSGMIAIDHSEKRAIDAAAQLASADPYTTACLGAAAMAAEASGESCENPDLRGELIPAVAAIGEDDDNRSQCWSFEERPVRFSACPNGSAKGYEKRLLMVGDSHAVAPVGALDLIGKQRNWRIDVASRAACHWNARPLGQNVGDNRPACAEWNKQLESYLRAPEQSDLDGIIVTHSARKTTKPEAGETPYESTVDGLVEAWSHRPSSDVPVIALLDNPMFEPDNADYLRTTLGCIQRHTPETAGEACGRPRADVLVDDPHPDAVARDPNAHVVDLTRFFCDESLCPAVIGNVVVYRDGNHITSRYARTLAPYLGPELAKIID
ncbi:peptidoglycan/LPS O-acetylase OafA/YrhL [Nocardioides albertanoniae]|uniref:Peptidoglycan/LPS O-acetylase OafA/YrhL n=1 Tax=Nocardioides albertanoniae TaxID=1175486 RepID=A0A543A6M9_9ACTN|nr:acyltransferase family protein [Nocardioides albertanoniae]TQL68261.1 peptidoglycan/LPS O-acetylase OafA/YrhL [Nocardioides albertanoniae]